MSITIKTSTTIDFFRRARATAKALDAGKQITGGITISFAKPEEMLRFMTERRIRLLRAVRKHPGSIKDLASSVHRKPDAVAKDLRLLKEAGLVMIRKVPNSKHGTMNFIEPVGDEVKLEAVV